MSLDDNAKAAHSLRRPGVPLRRDLFTCRNLLGARSLLFQKRQCIPEPWIIVPGIDAACGSEQKEELGRACR